MVSLYLGVLVGMGAVGTGAAEGLVGAGVGVPVSEPDVVLTGNGVGVGKAKITPGARSGRCCRTVFADTAKPSPSTWRPTIVVS